MAEESKPSDLKTESLAGSDEGSVTGDWDEQEEVRLLRKIDMRCMPTLIILFILNFLDVSMPFHKSFDICTGYSYYAQRGSLANARLKGLQSDLHLNDVQYATALSVLFAGYIVMQVPSNLIMNTIPKPRLYIGFVVGVWGLISALTSLCTNFSHIVVCRFFLGFVEAAFYPGSVYYLSRWYTRKEVGFRIALLNAGNMLAQGLGGLMAAGILQGLDNARGIRGWRWLFIIEGSITVFFALLIPFILADYPSSTKWLSDRERHIAQGRLVKDVGLVDNPDENEKSSTGILHGVWLAITDLKVWFLMFMYFIYLMGLSFGQYMPTITATLGFNTTITLLLTFPPWAFATIFALFNSWHSDRTGEKFWHIAVSYGFAILGYIVALTSNTIAGRYVSLFGMTMGYSAGIILQSWISSSIPRPPLKRAASIGFVNGFANIGQIPTSYLWPSKWGHRYWQSFTTEIVLMVLSLTIGFAYRQYLISLNKKLEQGEAKAFTADADAVEKSAELVNTSLQQERQLIEKFRYLY